MCVMAYLGNLIFYPFHVYVCVCVCVCVYIYIYTHTHSLLWCLLLIILRVFTLTHQYMGWIQGTKLIYIGLLQILHDFKQIFSYSCLNIFNGLPTKILELKNHKLHFKAGCVVGVSYYSFLLFKQWFLIRSQDVSHNWYL